MAQCLAENSCMWVEICCLKLSSGKTTQNKPWRAPLELSLDCAIEHLLKFLLLTVTTKSTLRNPPPAISLSPLLPQSHWQGLPGELWSPQPWRCPRKAWTWHTVLWHEDQSQSIFENLGDLFQSWSHDSMISYQIIFPWNFAAAGVCALFIGSNVGTLCSLSVFLCLAWGFCHCSLPACSCFLQFIFSVSGGAACFLRLSSNRTQLTKASDASCWKGSRVGLARITKKAG